MNNSLVVELRLGMLFSRSARTGQALTKRSAFALSPHPALMGLERKAL